MYKFLVRPILFLFDPERIHHLTMTLLRFTCLIPGMKEILSATFTERHPLLERRILGLTFSNPVGLAAGFDKDALYVDELSSLGFAFVEIGTVTPRAQPGNEKPRLFRLMQDKALINRMGFNNRGAAAAAEHLKKRKSRVIVGGNIGKNKDTPNEHALQDYKICLDLLHPLVDYFVVNVSSPNTPGLRDLQEKDPLRQLLDGLKAHATEKGISKPLLVKISPDLSVEQRDDVVEILKGTGIHGVVISNTTTSRDYLETPGEMVSNIGGGGLSGKPLALRSNELIRYFRQRMGEDFPIIGVGGIMTPQDALDKLASGANLVQVYTGFIYEGPGFVRRINQKLVGESA